jgi:hypothetical protein
MPASLVYWRKNCTMGAFRRGSQSQVPLLRKSINCWNFPCAVPFPPAYLTNNKNRNNSNNNLPQTLSDTPQKHLSCNTFKMSSLYRSYLDDKYGSSSGSSGSSSSSRDESFSRDAAAYDKYVSSSSSRNSSSSSSSPPPPPAAAAMALAALLTPAVRVPLPTTPPFVAK